MTKHGSSRGIRSQVYWLIWAFCVLIPVLAGCNSGSSQEQPKGGEQPAASNSSQNLPQVSQSELQKVTGDPVSAVKVFLEAVRTGDDERVVALFSEEARKQAGQLNRQFAPVGSDTARYEVFEDVQYLAPDGARVRTHWTDLDSRGQPRTDEITWMLRKEANGWRVAGMATVIFEGEPPLLLDFENMQETLRKVEMLSEEIERRQEAAQKVAAKQDGEDAGGENQASGQLPNSPQQDPSAADLPAAPGVNDGSTMTALKPDEPITRE